MGAFRRTGGSAFGPGRRGNVSIKRKLVVLALGVIAVVLLITFIGYTSSRRLLVEQIEDMGMLTAQLATAEASSFLKERENLLLSALGAVENILQRQGFDRERVLDVMEFWGKRGEALQVNGLYMGTTDDRYLDSTGWEPPADYVIRQRPWYVDTFRNNRLTYSEPYVDAAFGGATILTISTPVRDRENTTVGVLAIDIDIAELAKFVVSRGINEKGYGILVDSTGLAVVHPQNDLAMQLNISEPSAQVPQQLAKIGQAMRRGEEGVGSYNFMGLHNEIFYKPLGHGWTIGIVVQVAELLSPAASLAIKQGVVGVAAVIVLGLLLFTVYRSVTRPVDRLKAAMGAVREGDMTVSVGLAGNDEISDVARVVDAVVADQREFLVSLRDQAAEIDDSTGLLDGTFKDASATAQSIARHAHDLTIVAEENADAIQGVSAGIEELAAAATGAATAASSVSEEAERLRRNAEESEQLLQQNTANVDEMGEAFSAVSKVVKSLDAKAGSIDGIVATIVGIADQTNLLALNAAIEAARAGEAGRGFAVVAEEVRKLAEDSNAAAAQIGQLARDIVDETGTAVGRAASGLDLATRTDADTRRTQERLSEVIVAVARIVDQIQNVAATSEEQSASLAEMAGSVDRVTKAAADNREKSEEIAHQVKGITERIDSVSGTADELRGMAAKNSGHIARYKLDRDGEVPPAPQLRLR